MLCMALSLGACGPDSAGPFETEVSRPATESEAKAMDLMTTLLAQFAQICPGMAADFAALGNPISWGEAGDYTLPGQYGATYGIGSNGGVIYYATLHPDIYSDLGSAAAINAVRHEAAHVLSRYAGNTSNIDTVKTEFTNFDNAMCY